MVRQLSPLVTPEENERRIAALLAEAGVKDARTTEANPGTHRPCTDGEFRARFGCFRFDRFEVTTRCVLRLPPTRSLNPPIL